MSPFIWLWAINKRKHLLSGCKKCLSGVNLEKKKKGGEKKKVLPPPCKPFTFIITLNSAKEFESKSYILVLHEQWSASKIDDMVKLDLNFFVLGLHHSQRCQHELAEIAARKAWDGSGCQTKTVAWEPRSSILLITLLQENNCIQQGS